MCENFKSFPTFGVIFVDFNLDEDKVNFSLMTNYVIYFICKVYFQTRGLFVIFVICFWEGLRV